ncbi:MAG: PqqD family peptide modification chaperone [Deltaproteobacteria bacterium]|nr:PqqD family peptide modification chaperone [Deltaproteobacteria bacterium]
MNISDTSYPIANPVVVLREELDDWALLYNPDTADAFGINPVGVALWRLIDGRRSMADLPAAISRQFRSAPVELADHLRAYLEQLVEAGLLSLSD